MMAVRCADCTRRWCRNREASETRFAQTADASLSDFGTSDVSPSTGAHVKSNGNGNGNGNCRYAERQRRRQRSLRGQRQPPRNLSTCCQA